MCAVLLYCVYCLCVNVYCTAVLCVLFVCKCVLYYCHRDIGALSDYPNGVFSVLFPSFGR
jgi:hypothetical protein